mmetsp:Transcript_433/g.1076  ORF Transcript_433/g.1076 Transcript_433/m.1076 type:complete len:149 (-) Transcript_433:773-1219(-)
MGNPEEFIPLDHPFWLGSLICMCVTIKNSLTRKPFALARLLFLRCTVALSLNSALRSLGELLALIALFVKNAKPYIQRLGSIVAGNTIVTHVRAKRITPTHVARRLVHNNSIQRQALFLQMRQTCEAQKDASLPSCASGQRPQGSSYR